MTWTYEKLDENYDVITCPVNDHDGSVTGHIVFGVKQWFDENPEERIRRGWIKHNHFTKEEIQARYTFDSQSQYLLARTRQVDEYTVEDEYYVMDKSEEMMLLEEMLEVVSNGEYSVRDFHFVIN